MQQNNSIPLRKTTASTSASYLAAITAMTVGLGCSESAPANPTWIDDVRPILMANCVRCHSNPSTAGAPEFFRLDAYGDVRLPNGDDLSGAAAISMTVAFRAGEVGDMPPAAPLPDYMRETLSRWAAQAPMIGRPVLGTRANNAAPSLTLDAAIPIAPAAVPAILVVDYRVSDADGDVVNGSLLARPATGDDIVISARFRSGRGRITWDTSSVPAGNYDLVAQLTDDLVDVEQMLGQISVRQ